MERKPTPDILGDVLAAQVAPAAPAATLVPLTAIKNDGGTQMRAALNPDTISEYMEVLDANPDVWPFPPIVIFYDGADHWLADGFHRVGAARQRGGLATIPADVRPGTRRDAILFAAGANASHGLRRTNADKRRAVEALLRDEEWRKWSDGEIARRCAVSSMTVGRIRGELESNNVIVAPSTRTGADGRTINTANIGAKAQPAVHDTPVWKLENIVREVWREVAGDYNAARMDPELVIKTANRSKNEIGSHGPFWMLCQKAADKSFSNGAYRYWRFSDMKQAINNVADQMTQAALDKRNADPAGKPMLAVFQTDEERDIAAGEAAADEAVRMVEADRAPAAAQPVPPAAPMPIALSKAEKNAAFNDRLAEIRAKSEQLRNASALVVDGDRPLPDWTAEPAPAAVPVSQRDDYDSDEWYTPAEYIEAAREVMGRIFLDPASSDLAQTVVKADRYVTRTENGLDSRLRWVAETVWLNPPYSNPAPWVEKLSAEYKVGIIQQAIVLVNNATETIWFQALLERYPVCLPAKRLAFWRHDHEGVTARQGQAVFYLGPDVDKFVAVFGQFGPVLRRVA